MKCSKNPVSICSELKAPAQTYAKLGVEQGKYLRATGRASFFSPVPPAHRRLGIGNLLGSTWTQQLPWCSSKPHAGRWATGQEPPRRWRTSTRSGGRRRKKGLDHLFRRPVGAAYTSRRQKGLRAKQRIGWHRQYLKRRQTQRKRSIERKKQGN